MFGPINESPATNSLILNVSIGLWLFFCYFCYFYSLSFLRSASFLRYRERLHNITSCVWYSCVYYSVYDWTLYTSYCTFVNGEAWCAYYTVIGDIVKLWGKFGLIDVYVINYMYMYIWMVKVKGQYKNVLIVSWLDMLPCCFCLFSFSKSVFIYLRLCYVRFPSVGWKS